MYTRALQGYVEAPGPKHTLTLDIVHNLGALYKDQGKLAEAEAMYTRALQGKEEALGPKHTLTLSTVHNLGLLDADQGRQAEVEAMYTRALQGIEEAFGPENLRLYLPASKIMFAFGDLFERTGRKDMAKEYTVGHCLDIQPSKDLPLNRVGSLKIGFKHCKLRLSSREYAKMRLVYRDRSAKVDIF